MPRDFDAVILSACRTPIGSFGGVFKDLTAVDLGAVVIREAIARAGVGNDEIGDVVMGCVLQAGAGMNVARQAALKAALPVVLDVVADVAVGRNLPGPYRIADVDGPAAVEHGSGAHPDGRVGRGECARRP